MYLSLSIFILAHAIGPIFFGSISELYSQVNDKYSRQLEQHDGKGGAPDSGYPKEATVAASDTMRTTHTKLCYRPDKTEPSQIFEVCRVPNYHRLCGPLKSKKANVGSSFVWRNTPYTNVGSLASGNSLEDDEMLRELKQELAKPLKELPDEAKAAKEVNTLLARVSAMSKKTETEPLFPENFRWAPQHITDLIAQVSELAPEVVRLRRLDVVYNSPETTQFLDELDIWAAHKVLLAEKIASTTEKTFTSASIVASAPLAIGDGSVR
ncbi:unnamed protein product [Penicillium bialowiezense]